MSRLDARLDDWARGVADGRPQATLESASRALLAEAESRVSDRRLPAALWHRFLDVTRQPAFLQALGGQDTRERWAEVAFAAIRASRYTLATLLAQRLAVHPERALFVESAEPGAACWSYEAVARRIERTAAVFLRASRGRPRVAILSANSVDAACADLACLVHGIPVSPINPETDPDGLGWILERLKFSVVAVQGDEQRQRLERAGLAGARVFLLDAQSPLRGAAEARLAEAAAQLAPAQIERTLAAHAAPDLDAAATVMFTSGSTGLPKGVVHSLHAIVTKRFARAAALPAVGSDETLLCYLPLFHTFGRYLEMLGMLFWGGSYVFAGNPSFETLTRALPRVRPTGLVGIPRRWAQLRERCLARPGDGDAALRAVVGDRLRWGLSAAGHLEPAVFRFFQRHGVELCSGFGMTEATGGITMTPPGAYEDGSVGVPLPGMRARLRASGELEIAGPYVGSYLDHPPAAAGDHWLATGDVFVRRPSGHFEIVDRVKDVYKNTRGQTVAPAAVERRLADVPGVRRAFLVGDGRDHNSLLIVPDRADRVLAGATPEAEDAYFRQIVAAVNREVSPPERVVSFALLDRDFDPERELTPKGSFRRREIERAFAPVIDSLYRRDAVEIACGPLRARLPRWLHRDLGLLERDLVAHPDGVLDRRSGRVLAIAPAPGGRVRVGDLAYRLEGGVVDLGLFARQPLLWVGNPALRAFAPCKDGWDVPLARVGPQVVAILFQAGRGEHPAAATAVGDPALEDAHAVSTRALFGRGEEALAAVEWMAKLLPHAEPRLGRLLRRRLEALAWHDELEVRCLAYRTLLLDEPLLGYGDLLASFVLAGRPFLTAGSIDAIARARPERYRLESLRERLRRYRRDLAWPATPEVRAVFEGIFDLLDGAARARPEQLVPVRAELAAWALFEADRALAGEARMRLAALADWCRAHVRASAGAPPIHGPISPEESRALSEVLADPSFLPQSVALAFDEPDTRALTLGPEGVWVNRLPSSQRHRLFRVSFETIDGHHRDLLLALRGDVADASVEETTLWMIALGDRPGQDGVVPRFGCARADLGALSTAYVSCLSLWERVRAWAGDVGELRTPEAWRSLFVRGLAAFFAGWRASDGRILPGTVAPTNVAVPRADYLADVRVLSLAGWQPYGGPHSLVEPMQRYFLEQSVGHYPALRGRLEASWIYDAAVEGLGLEGARGFLADLASEPGDPPGGHACLAAFRERLERSYYEPLALRGAIARYADWQRSNPRATPAARRQLASQMHGLYGLDAHGELARYQLYRRSYFERAAPPVAALFDRLLQKLFERRGEPATRLVELSELQSALDGAEDRRALGELVFPRSQALQDAELRSAPGVSRVLVLSHVVDGRGTRFAVREPVSPVEVGRLYRLLSESGLAAGGSSRQLVLLDAEERVVGGITWRVAAPRVAHIEGIVLAPGLRSQRLAGPLIEDFCARRASAGDVAVHTHFGPGPFPFAPGFGVDRRWGGLVRFLGSAAAGEARPSVSG